MYGNHTPPKWARLSGGAVALCVLSLLIVFGLGTAWLFDVQAAKAAEPDLTLLKAAYASSTLSSFDLQLLELTRTIPAAAFNPDSNSRTWFFGFNSSYLYSTSASGYCGAAPLYLPQGAIITSFTAYVYDDDAINNISVFLLPKQLGTFTSASSAAELVSTGQSTAVQVLTDTTVLPAVIDNAGYTYHIGICMWSADSNVRFYAARVNYALPPVYLPMIRR